MIAHTCEVINYYGLFAITFLYVITHIYFHFNILSKILKIVLLLAMMITTMMLSFHLFPGFSNLLIIDKIQVSSLSVPFSMYLNFDKTIAAIILLINSNLCSKEKLLNIRSIIITLKLLLVCAIIIISFSLLSEYIKFNFKIPNILFIWSINNLLFVCFSEEVIFRGIIQNELKLLSLNQYTLLLLASLIFGLAHFKGGVGYILLTFIAGVFYGFVYQKTNKILCAIFIHFGLNLIHLLFFTYPAAIKLVS